MICLLVLCLNSQVNDYLTLWDRYLNILILFCKCNYCFAYKSIMISVEQYYNTVIIIDYQLQIPLHFGSIAKTEPCEYRFNLLTYTKPLAIIFVIFICNLLFNLMVSLLSTETDRFNIVDKFKLLNFDEQLLDLILYESFVRTYNNATSY